MRIVKFVRLSGTITKPMRIWKTMNSTIAKVKEIHVGHELVVQSSANEPLVSES